MSTACREEHRDKSAKPLHSSSVRLRGTCTEDAAEPNCPGAAFNDVRQRLAGLCPHHGIRVESVLMCVGKVENGPSQRH